MTIGTGEARRMGCPLQHSTRAPELFL